MTRKMFWEDPYLHELQTHITGVKDNEVTVAGTIFYAFAGGQERDYGAIGDFEVYDARKDGLEIIYTIADGHPLQVGDAVQMTIDWERRYRLMRLHFAAEIVLELAYQNLAGIKKIGAHIGQDKSRIDFLWQESIADSFPLLSEKAKALIDADLPITSAFSNVDEERRYWEIEGFGKVDCGGTHIKSTGEVGALTLRRKNIGKNKERIEIFIDE